MNWEALAAIGQLLGSIAVLVTIAYLAMQVRSAKQEIARSARQARTDGLREFWLTRASQPELTAAWCKLSTALGVAPQRFIAVATDAGLSDVEAWQVYALEWARWLQIDQNVVSLDQYDPGTRTQTENLMLFYADGIPGKWYATTKHMLNPDAVRHIDNLLAKKRTAS